MAGKLVHVELPAADTKRATQFYGQLFRWQFHDSAEDKNPIPGIGWFARCKDTEGNAFALFESDESVAPPQGS